MSLWVDKYRPRNLAKLDYHKDQADMLKNLVQSGDFPHLLIYGPPGVGKKTRIMCLLKELYGPGAERIRIEQNTFKTPSGRKLEVVSLASNYHIEVNPSNVGNDDRVVVQELIKNIAQTQQLESGQQKSFKVVLITEADHLTKDAQHALRRTMEKYMATCRIILCCNATSEIIPAIKSRCLGVRVPAPSNEEIINILQFVCKKEGLTLPAALAERIANQCERNLRRALLMCEACKVQQYPFEANQDVCEPDWTLFLRDTASSIIQEQSPKRLYEVRGRLYELLVHCIPPDIIMKKLLKELLENIDGSLKIEVTEMAAFYEHRMQLGQKPIFHLEAFVAKFMAMYKRFLEVDMAAFL